MSNLSIKQVQGLEKILGDINTAINYKVESGNTTGSVENEVLTTLEDGTHYLFIAEVTNGEILVPFLAHIFCYNESAYMSSLIKPTEIIDTVVLSLNTSKQLLLTAPDSCSWRLKTL